MGPMLLSAFGTGEQTIAAIVIAVLIIVIVTLFSPSLPPSRKRRFRPHRFFSSNQRQGFDPVDVGEQLHAVMAGTFEKRKILSISEYRVFAIIETEIAAQGAGYRVFAQTSLGQILKSNDPDAFQSINSKRVDILVVDRSGWPVLAVEYQGGGHYQGTAAARDAIKKEALRKAGVRYVEVCDADTSEQIRSRIREHLTRQ